jgi:tetratricopeptide (TPR) repeat protein
LEINPGDEFALKVLALFRDRIQTSENELEAFADAYTVAVVDEQFANRMRLGYGYLNLGQFHKALETFEKTFEEAKEGARDEDEYLRRQAEALTGYGSALHSLFRRQADEKADTELLKESERIFRMALDLDPNFAPALAGLGDLYLGAGYADIAEQILRRALEIDPGSALASAGLNKVVEDKLKQRLHALGFLTRIRDPITNLASYEDRTPIIALGKPASEIIIEERR